MTYDTPALPYAYDALEPFIDKETMQVHHDKHHTGYTKKLNVAVGDFEDLAGKPAEDLLKELNSIPEEIRRAVRNAGGGHVNHAFFWPLLKKDGGKPTGELLEAINTSFGSYDAFKESFTKAATTLFGSGWTWLVKDGATLKVINTTNQDSPLSKGLTPVLALDIWEHSYYLKYKNRRPEYVEAFFSIINWEQAKKNFNKE